MSVAIIAVLGAASLGVYGEVRSKGALVKEINNAKSVITAYNLYPADHDGEFMPAEDSNASAVWYEPLNRNVTGQPVTRYPFRLMKYLGYQSEDILYNSDTKAAIDSTSSRYGGKSEYGMSLYPRFGINWKYVGGRKIPNGFVDGSGFDANIEVLKRTAHAEHNIIAFVSASDTFGSSKTGGWWKVEAPTNADAVWSGTAWSSSSRLADYGRVDARFDGKAVCAFIDGSVKALSIEELRDMRLWSRQAAALDRSDYNYGDSQN